MPTKHDRSTRHEERSRANQLRTSFTAIRASKSRGFTLVETIIYVISAILLVGAIGGLMYYMYGWYGTATIIPRTDQAGTTLVDRIVRDVRSGTSINASGTSLGTTLGSISLTSSPNGTNVTKAYAVSNGRATYSQNGAAAAYITPSQMTVSQLKFTEIDAGSISKSIRVDLQLTYSMRSGTSTRSYTGLAVMRNSYQ
jgi:hypothetical protein